MRISEVRAIAFDETSVGQRVESTVVIDRAAVDAFSGLSGDVNPLHMEESFAQARGYPGRVVHGLLVSAYFSCLLGTMLPGRDCLLLQIRFDFKKPVILGESVAFSLEILQKAESVRTLELAARAIGPDGELRVSGRILAGFTA